MGVQIIEKDGKPEWAVIPYETYQRLLEEAEMLQDIQDYDEAKKAIAEGEELIPSQVTYAILDGQNPIKIWRKYRGLTQQQLAEMAGMSRSHLSQIESGKREGSPEELTAIAKALRLALDDIIASQDTK
jgi:DNA-binding XRE family transcriptional regulator